MDYHVITEEEKKIISAWNYSGKYEVYNLPSYEEQVKKGICLKAPNRDKNYYTYLENQKIIGFTNISETKEAVSIGIGVNPDCCNRGYGTQIMKQAVQIAKEQYPDKPLCLIVRTWNKRAIRCYEKAGFVIDGDEIVQKTPNGVGKFYRMVKRKEQKQF